LESDEVATIPIKGKTSSSKSLFPKLSKHTCLMAKEGRHKVKSNASSSPKCVTSDEDTLSSDNYDSSDDDNSLPSKLVKNPNAMIKGFMRQVGARDELLEQREELLIQERKISKELKKLLALEKGRVEKLDQELAKNKETTCSLKSSIGALQGQHNVLLKTHHDLEVQFGALWSSTSKTLTNDKASTSQVSVEMCDDKIAQENDHLKREVKKLELELNKLKKKLKCNLLKITTAMW
jgi:chromosome segregation ATPase